MKVIYILFAAVLFWSCKNKTEKYSPESKELATLFQNYWEENLQLYPFQATAIGDNRYNDQFPNNQTQAFRDKEKQFAEKYLNALKNINKNSLNNFDKESYNLLKYDLELLLEGQKFSSYYTPINQFWSFTLEFAQLGAGSGNQPFKTVKDYENFIERIKNFPAWTDTVIQNMRTGMQKGYVLPKALVEKMIPQAKSVATVDPTRSIFYMPVKNIPVNFSTEEKKKIENIYFYNIGKSIIPAYSKLANFLKNEYLPNARATNGLSSLPNGAAYYSYLIKRYTTTNKTADEIYAIGQKEVARIKAEMEKVKNEVGFKGDLKSFFEYINSDKKFTPFATDQDVLNKFRTMQKTIDSNIPKYFSSTPKTPFEIRQTESFRAASASAEYNAGSEDGTRPGIFYVPILDAKKFNEVGMETLFLHEAIPGHHYQISIQQENKNLPQFRKFLGYSSYAEGWALYTETLGKELGLFKDPYQYLGHLSDQMHRALRLVVDVGIHTKNLSREDAIQYMKDNERISNEEATSEIERYMAIPGQALSYMIGKKTIEAMRDKYQKQEGNKFSYPVFHEQILNGGNMPLSVLEEKLKNFYE